MASETARISVRRARADELEVVGAVTVAAYEEFLLGPTDPYRDRLADAALRDREAEVWVAVDAADPTHHRDQVLGTVTLCPPGSSWRELSAEDEGEFRMLAVAPAARGRGVGRRLVGAAVDRCRADGASRVVLSSLVDMHAAHRLYESLGFHRLPERDWRPLPQVELIAYSLELT